MDYDGRDRDPRLAQSPAFATAVTRELRRRFGRLTSRQLAQTMVCRCLVRCDGGAGTETATTAARELVYCLAHAHHHFALIAVIARLNGVRLPADFGLAPSTLAHRAETAAATISLAA